MPEDRLELLVGGTIYAGWESIGVSLPMDAAAGTFSLAVTDRWSAKQDPWPITPGDTCEVRVSGQTIIAGYVDQVRPGFSSRSHGIEVQGRDKSGDMVDCSADHQPDEWRGITLLRLAEILGAPFGIKAKAETDVGAPIDLVKLQQGETALEALQRYARMRKVLIMPDGAGGILLTRTGTRRAEVQLVQGDNILEASGTLDSSDRFSIYTVKGQGQFSEETDGEKEAHVLATATDAGVTRYRPLVIIADTEANDGTAKERADWEANTRIGASAKGTITVQGWRQTPGGSLWLPNTLVRVRAPWLRLDGEMLIREVVFLKNDRGTTTQLDIVSPQAYEPEPPDDRKKKKKKGGKGGNPWEAALGNDAAPVGGSLDPEEGEDSDE